MLQSPISNNNGSGIKAQPLIAGLYARVSTNRQEEQETIKSQIDEIKKRISEDGNVLPPENIFVDDGWTGEMLQRPGLDTMRDAAIEDRFQILYVYDRGRLSRVFAYQEIILEEIINKEIKFVTLHDVKAETPEERVLQAMQGVFHEYERVKIAERMRRGKLYKARSGILINGNSLYGYNYVKKTATVPAHYKINEEETRVVRMIVNWVGNEGISLREVIKRLYSLKIPPRKKKSEFWTKGPLVRLLQCEAYSKGIIYYNKSEAVVAKKPIKNEKYKKVKRSSRKVRPREDWIPYTKIPTILEDNGLYEKVQKILENNQKYARKNRKYDYLLSGLVFCECGNRRAGDGYSKGGNHYYRCAERIYKFPIEKKCKSQGVNAVVLDQLFWKELVNYLQEPSLIRKHVEEWFRSEIESNANSQEKSKLGNFIQKIEEEEERYAKAYGEGLLEFEQFKDLIKDSGKRKQAYKAQVESLNKSISLQSIGQFSIDEICKEAKKVLENLDLSNKIMVIRDIIDKIIVKGGKEVEVWGHIPLNTLKMAYEPISRDCGVAERGEVNAL